MMKETSRSKHMYLAIRTFELEKRKRHFEFID